MTLNAINYMNIGLMIISVILAFILPFELFMFSYAILGPLHYLTEISWLHDRKYFSPGKWDWVPLVVISLLILGTTSYFSGIWEGVGLKKTFEDLGNWYPDMMFLAFGIALLFIITQSGPARVFGIVVLFVGMLALHREPGSEVVEHGESMYKITTYGALYKVFGVYLPTLIHVYIFTGLFILFGALKSRSVSGYISFAVFILCPALCFLLFTDTSGYHPTAWALENFSAGFKELNVHFLDDFAGYTHGNAYFSLNPLPKPSQDPVFYNSLTVMFMRFVAFAYTYHYLNWFSKTSVIKWHEVSRARIAFIVLIWIASICLYLTSYDLGFKWLFLLSFMHVLLEFPLNHQTFVGIGKEIRKRVSGAPQPG